MFEAKFGRFRHAALAASSAGALVAAGGCVPEGPATTNATSTSKSTAATRPKAAASARVPARPALVAPFEDRFEREELGPDWNALSPRWRISAGRLCVRGARNRGIWLSRKVPENARIEFDAYAESTEGDLKAELWGDGESGATAASYTNATSYLAILGGWKNTKHVLARLDEHGDDRQVLEVDTNTDDERARPVSPGQPYRFRIERTDGRTVSFSVNGLPYHELLDDSPLTGPGHEHLGFNNWDAPVCFDNLQVTPL